MSCVTCQASHVTCHISPVTWQLSSIIEGVRYRLDNLEENSADTKHLFTLIFWKSTVKGEIYIFLIQDLWCLSHKAVLRLLSLIKSLPYPSEVSISAPGQMDWRGDWKWKLIYHGKRGFSKRMAFCIVELK